MFFCHLTALATEEKYEAKWIANFLPGAMKKENCLNGFGKPKDECQGQMHIEILIEIVFFKEGNNLF